MTDDNPPPFSQDEATVPLLAAEKKDLPLSDPVNPESSRCLFRRFSRGRRTNEQRAQCKDTTFTRAILSFVIDFFFFFPTTNAFDSFYLPLSLQARLES